MDTSALTNFIVLYETGSMHKAGEKLFISQQGLSRVIRRLEAEWGTVLFERTPGGVVPTPSGEYFYQEARKLQMQLKDMQREISRLNTGKEDISLACSYGILHILYPLLKAFEAENPKYIIRWAEFSDAEADRKVLSREAELGLCIRQTGDPTLDFIPLFSRPMMLLVYQGHPFWEKDTIDICDLQHERVIIEGEDFHIFDLFVQLCLDAGFYPDIAAQTTEISFCQHLCRLKEGVSVTTDFIAETSNLEGLRAIPFTDTRFCWTAGIGSNPGTKQTEGAALLAEYLLKTCREQSCWSFI